MRGDICPQCCGTEREVTVQCPFECPYLEAAREHERLPELDPKDVPNQDIRITEDYLYQNGHLIAFLAGTLAEISLATPGVVDSDVGDALDSLIRTYRTLQSGLYYETRPNNPVAASVHAGIQQRLQELRERTSREGHSIRDVDILGGLVVIQRRQIALNNGRRLGRAFLDAVRKEFSPPDQAPSPASSIIQP